jgi:hypothetical protein
VDQREADRISSESRHSDGLVPWRAFASGLNCVAFRSSGECCVRTGHRPVATGDCFKESTAAARRNELAGRTDAVDHHAIADRVLRRFDYFAAQSASDHTFAFLGRRLFLSPFPPSFYAPRHKKQSRLGGVVDSKILRRDLEARGQSIAGEENTHLIVFETINHMLF